MEAKGRQIRTGVPVLTQGQTGTLTVDLQALGNENALAFSLSFDPGQLVFASATTGADAGGAVLNVNANEAAQGRIGCVLALSANESFAAGNKHVVDIKFRSTLAASGASAISFGDRPVLREISDAGASALAADYIINAATTTQLPSLNITASANSISLSWPTAASGFVLQESSDATLKLASWSAIKITPAVANSQSVVTMPLGTSKKFYRLCKP
jgi:hypothetical protein